MFSFLGNHNSDAPGRAPQEMLLEEATDLQFSGGGMNGGSARQRPPASPRRARKGGVALALGGGAAKGWAHIGLLRAFEEANIAISMIAGTSIGAVVGGCYLAGKLDELEEFARSLTRPGMLRYLDFSLTGNGLISGQRLTTHLKAHMSGIDIEQLDIPFVTICTDILTGHEIWLHDGPLIEAIRASYALPGVFSPLVHNGRMLVDGAIVNPVPVSACRAYEPEVVIAADLNSETFGRGTVIRASHYDGGLGAPAEPVEAPENMQGADSASTAMLAQAVSDAAAMASSEESNGNQVAKALVRRAVQPKSRLGMMGVMMEAFNIIQDRIARARLAGDPPDFTIRPRLGHVGLADFYKADEAIEAGYNEARTRLRELIEQGVFEPA